jgi:2-iminoacetate synthase
MPKRALGKVKIMTNNLFSSCSTECGSCKSCASSLLKSNNPLAGHAEQNSIKPQISWPEKMKKHMEENKKYGDGSFIDENAINSALEKAARVSDKNNRDRIRKIIAKSKRIETLSLDETAALLNVEDQDLWQEIFEAGLEIKKSVYDNRIVTFAPLYCSNLCVNRCAYCGFNADNTREKRRRLTIEEVRKETEALAGVIGHKRLIVVYGEHPDSSIDYIADTIKKIYSVDCGRKDNSARIRRVNINAAPMSVNDLKRLKELGVGTYQVFHETYHRETYARMHPAGTLKSDYNWRLYCHHRAMEAGIDDVAIGVLFGLYDWKFEVLGLLSHAIELESKFNIGPHTISFPRLEPADNSDVSTNSKWHVSDRDFKRLVAVIRLAVPYTGLIITARESPEIREDVMFVGCTQTDASTKIGIGAYSDGSLDQESERQQFILGDTRSLDEMVRRFAQLGYITSFCTAGYRCGRTGDKIMEMLKCGKEGHLCKLNAVLTFKEWIDDFGSKETKKEGEKILKEEIEGIKEKFPKIFDSFFKAYQRICNGERDIFF